VRVLNADVLVVDGRHIRLADVVAPQPIPQARCWAEALAAKQARLAARELVRTTRDLRVEPTGKTDEYDRAVAHVFLDNQDLAGILHDAGFVAAAQPGRFSWCAPVSTGGEGAPDLKSLMDFSRG
jgi:endonuclease YncB( thermonuclease family)